jgi:TIR domain
MTVAGQLREVFDYLCPFCKAPYRTIEENGKSKFVHKGVTSTRDKVSLPTTECVPHHDYVVFQPCGHCCPDVFDKCRACKLGLPGTIERVSLPTLDECHCHYCYEESTLEVNKAHYQVAGGIGTPTVAQQVLPAPKIFISYSHKDEAFKDELDIMLAGLNRRSIVDVWHDRRIEAGAEWMQEITRAMNECRMAVLLVSPDFIASRFIQEEELSHLLQRRKAEGLRVIPIIVRHCLWQYEPVLHDLQVLPKDATPVISFAKESGDRDKVWADIGKTIEKLAAGIKGVNK